MSETVNKPEMDGRKTGRFRLAAFYPFAILLSIGIGLVVTGVLINKRSGVRATMELQPGQHVRDAELIKSSPGLPPEFIGFDFTVTLDSLIIQDHVPRYEIHLLQRDDQSIANPHTAMPAVRNRIETFPLTPMEIHTIAGTEFRFRLSNFYPNFRFSYTYPDQIDTIEARAPGMMLDLKTAEGEAIVTLRTDQPGKHVLGDVVGFGATLEFQWELQDVIPKDDSVNQNRILFVGKERMVYFLMEGKIDSQSLEKDQFYQIPGKPELGFRLMHLFPDAMHLKAIPSSDGTELINPVAEVQIWKVGQGYQEVFIYPGKTAGTFDIPGTPFALVLDISQDHILQFVEAIISIESDGGEVIEAKPLTKKNALSFDRYHIELAGYNPQQGGQIKVQMSRTPGNPFIYAGTLILLSGLLLILFKRRIFQ